MVILSTHEKQNKNPGYPQLMVILGSGYLCFLDNAFSEGFEYQKLASFIFAQFFCDSENMARDKSAQNELIYPMKQ